MTAAASNSPYTPSQIQVWLRGLLTVAWADGQFDDAAQSMIHTMVESEFAPGIEFETLEPIEPAALIELELSEAAAQNFLRMTVMVALADGVYSEPENEQIMEFAQALALDPDVLASLSSALSSLKEAKLKETELNDSELLTNDSELLTAEANPSIVSDAVVSKTVVSDAVDDGTSAVASSLRLPAKKAGIDPLKPARVWLDQLSVDDPRLARFVCKLVPSQCPFERDVKLFGRKVVHIPPMCKINPLYEQLVGLRFRALCYLADDCGEDVSSYT